MAARAGSFRIGEGTGLPSPFPPLGLEFSKDESRETAYEIFAAACKTSLPGLGRSKSGLTYRSLSSQRSLTFSATSKMKRALGLRPKTGDNEAIVASSKTKKPLSAIEIVRLQMGISEQADARIRRALSRTTAGQVECF